MKVFVYSVKKALTLSCYWWDTSTQHSEKTSFSRENALGKCRIGGKDRLCKAVLELTEIRIQPVKLKSGVGNGLEEGKLSVKQR